MRYYKYFDYLTLFLLSFLILFPKLPFIPVEGTYIQIRIEDFVVAGVYFLWVLGILLKRLKLRWGKVHALIAILFLLGAASTFLGYFLHHTVNDPILAGLHVLRRLEYALMFFLMVSSFKRENLKNYLAIILTTAAVVTIYGLLALKFDLPQARTMGSPGTITTYEQVGFVQSTFGGHYDLGAFLMMTMPLLLSMMMFELSKNKKKNLPLFTFYFLLFTFAFVLLQASFSRAAVIANALSLTFFFVTLKSWWTLLPAAHFARVMYLYFTNRYSKYAYNLSFSFGPSPTPSLTPAPSLTLTPTPSLTPTPQPTLPPGITPTIGPSLLPPTVTPTPSLTLTPVALPGTQVQIGQAQVGLDVSGAMRASAWPKLIKDTFTINPLFGQGYSAIGIGADGDYIRWLSEMGLVGMAAWFVTLGTVGWQLFGSFRKATDPFAKYIQLAILTAVVGLVINAGLIDIFESSKIAFFFWTLTGIGISLSSGETREV